MPSPFIVVEKTHNAPRFSGDAPHRLNPHRIPRFRSCLTPGKWFVALVLLMQAPAALSQIAHSFPLVTPASNTRQVGLVRILNHSDQAGTVNIHAIDDRGRRFGPVTLSMDAKAAVQLPSRNLEEGNASKGLSGGVGDGTGDWRLEFDTTLDIEALAYIRTPDGFLTSIHEVAPSEEPDTAEEGWRYRLAFFNPATNRSLQSRVRLINPGEEVAEISIDARDARGNAPPGGEVSLTLLPGTARTLTRCTSKKGLAA